MINLTKKNTSIFYESLKKSGPEELLKKRLNFNNKDLLILNKKKSIYKNKDFYLISFGKASQKMYLGASNIFGESFSIKDYLVISHQRLKSKKINKNKFFLSTHPLVSSKSYKSALKLLLFIKKIPKNSNVIILVSGGGSSMLAHPVKDLEFDNKSKFINLLINQGIGEREVNFFRKILSSIKSGKLIEHFDKCKIFNIIWSDERSNKIDAISSGISVPQDNKKIEKFLLNTVYNKSFCTPKLKKLINKNNIEMRENSFGNTVKNYIIADRMDLVDELKNNFRNNNFNKIFYGNHIYENSYSKALNSIEKSISTFYNKNYSGLNALILTGEIPVLAKKNGKGGRNQHLAASLISFLKNYNNFSLGCFSTDGCDFIKGVHGAYIDDGVIDKIVEKKIDYNKYLDETNTYHLHKKTKSLLEGDYTGNNFSDFYVFIYKG